MYLLLKNYSNLTFINKNKIKYKKKAKNKI